MSTRPNLVLVVCHDLGRHLPAYGVGTVISPHLNRLAGESFVATQAFCTAPQCSPSRASLFTGRYPHCTGVMGLTHCGWDLHPAERHLAGVLREAGYDCALAGIQHETQRPAEMGYELLPCAQTDVAPYHSRLVAEAVADTACAWLADPRRRTRPFYLQVGFEEPHRQPGHPIGGFGYGPDIQTGVTIPPYLADTPEARQDFAEFQGAISALDRAVGRLLAKIATAGLAERTLFVFTTDHGIPFPRAKCSLFDAGLETALFVRGPGVAPRRAEALISNLDLFPTVLEMLGVTCPPGVQGTSFAGVLRGTAESHREVIFGEMTYHDYFDPRRCVRTRTHKLIVNFTVAPFFMDPSQAWQRRTRPRQPREPALSYHPLLELYDLERDPLEEHNLAQDPAATPVLHALCKILADWMRSTNDPLLQGVPVSASHCQALEVLGLAERR